MSSLNNKHVLVTILEIEKSKLKGLADLVPGDACFLFHRRPSSCCILTCGRERARELSRVPFVRPLISLIKTPSSLPKDPPNNTSTSGLKISTYDFWGTQHPVHNNLAILFPTHFLLTSKIHSNPTAPKVLIHFGINSKKSKVYLNII